MQAVRCVEVISLLMKQHFRGLVEEGLQAYLQLWQEYAVEPGSLAAYAGIPGVCARQHESDCARCVLLLPATPLPCRQLLCVNHVTQKIRTARVAVSTSTSNGSGTCVCCCMLQACLQA